MTPTSPGQPFEERPRRERVPRQLLTIATVAVLAAGGLGTTVTASAATPPPAATETPTEPPTTTPTETPPGTPTEPPTDTPTESPAPIELPPINPWGFVGTMHGEFAVATADGCGTVTLLAQTGQVTAQAEGSLTVRSQDGFEQSYTLADSTRLPVRLRGEDEQAEQIEQDAWVSVTATTDGQTATAAYVLDLSQPMRSRPHGKNDWKRLRQWLTGVPKWQTPTPCPTPTQTVTPLPTDTPTTAPIPPETPTQTPTEPPAETPTETPTS